MINNLFGARRVPSPIAGRSFNPYAAGNKHYGSGRPMPNIGPVAHPIGYAERDNKSQAKKNAILRRLKGQSGGNPMDLNVLGYRYKGVFK